LLKTIRRFLESQTPHTRPHPFRQVALAGSYQGNTESMKLLAIFVLSVLFLSAAQAQQKERRVALLIGNASYKYAPLRIPVNDANDVAAGE
jgi:hypothetical protein